MATYSQIVLVRAGETQGVWALDAAFTGGGHTKDEHASLISSVSFKRAAKDTAAGVTAAAEGVVALEHEFFKSINVPIADRLASEVTDNAALLQRVEEARIRPAAKADIERRSELTFVVWKEVNAARAALVPPKPAIVVRGVTQAAYETRYEGLLAKKTIVDTKDGLLTAARTAERSAARQLDLWNKSWYLAWKSEFPEGTEKGDALSNVHTPEGTPVPGILVITGVTQTGLSLAVAYDPETGEHASVLELLYKVAGMHTEFQRVAADKVAGNTIGPFLVGQVVTLGTDVGNSRDSSELSPEQTVTIGPAV